MARNKFRLFHLILEVCKSSFLYSPHLVHVDTYIFPKILVGDSPKLVAVFLVSLFGEVWLSHKVSTVINILHCLGVFLDGCGTSSGLLSLFQVLVSNQDKLGNSSSTPSCFLIFTGQSREFPYCSWFNPHLVVCCRGWREYPVSSGTLSVLF